MATRADRNNNPGNIKATEWSKKLPGVVGVEQKPAADGGHFLIFDSPEHGFNAMKTLLTEGRPYQGVTAEQAIKKWNGGGAYSAATVGLDPNVDIQVQLKDPSKLNQVVLAMAHSEGFGGGAPASTASTGKKSYHEFARSLKQKYPQYASADDLQLAQAVVAKYPQYASSVEFPQGQGPSIEMSPVPGVGYTSSSTQETSDQNTSANQSEATPLKLPHVLQNDMPEFSGGPVEQGVKQTGYNLEQNAIGVGKSIAGTANEISNVGQHALGGLMGHLIRNASNAIKPGSGDKKVPVASLPNKVTHGSNHAQTAGLIGGLLGQGLSGAEESGATDATKSVTKGLLNTGQGLLGKIIPSSSIGKAIAGGLISEIIKKSTHGKVNIPHWIKDGLFGD